MTFPDRLNAAEDAAAIKLSAQFLKSVKVTIKKTDWQKIESNLQAWANGDAIVDGIAWEEYDPRVALSKLFEVSAGINGEYIGSITSGAKFDLVDPNALKWIEQYAADDVKLITDSQKASIKDIILQGYQDGITPQAQARMIRDHIGLDERRSETLRKYGEDLFSKGKDEAEVWKLMETKGKALLNDRAETIAINEATEAAGQATYESTKSAVERGVLDPNRYEAFRIITGDERTCEICIEYDGETRKLPDGVYASTGASISKMHPLCRCPEGIREIGMKEKADVHDYSDVFFEEVGEAEEVQEYAGIIQRKTVPLVEGVFTGRGFPVLRTFEEFSKDAHWLDGVVVLNNHESLTPHARRLGQLKSPSIDPQRKRVQAITNFFESDLTPREVKKIKGKDPFHGSLLLACHHLDYTPGIWHGKKYEAIERGPYVWYEYSVVPKGVVTPEDGAGFNVECDGCHKEHTQDYIDKFLEQIKPLVSNDVFGKIHRIARAYAGGKGKAAVGQILAVGPSMESWDGTAAKKEIFSGDRIDDNGKPIKSKCEKYFLQVDGDGTLIGDYHYPIGTPSEFPDRDALIAAYVYASQHDPGLLSKIKSIAKANKITFPAIESQSQSSAPGGADMESDQVKEMIEEAVAPLRDRNATLEQKNTALEGEVKTLKEGIEKEKADFVLKQFAENLKPGHEGKAVELFAEYQKDPAKWVLENSDKFVIKGQEKGLQGNAITGGSPSFDLAAEQAKINYTRGV